MSSRLAAGRRRARVAAPPWMRSPPQARGVPARQQAGKTLRLPADPVVLAVIARAAPHRPVCAIDLDSIDGAGAALLEIELVTHLGELLPNPGRRRRIHGEPSG